MMRELRISGVLGVVQEPSPAAGGGGVRFTFRYMMRGEPATIEIHTLAYSLVVILVYIVFIH